MSFSRFYHPEIATKFREAFVRTLMPRFVPYARLKRGAGIDQILSNTLSNNHFYNLSVEKVGSQQKLIFNPSVVAQPECHILSHALSRRIIPSLTIIHDGIFSSENDFMPASLYFLFLDNHRSVLRETGEKDPDSGFNRFNETYWDTSNHQNYVDFTSQFQSDMDRAELYTDSLIMYSSTMITYFESLVLHFRVTDGNWRGPEFFINKPHNGLLKKLDDECTRSFSMGKKCTLYSYHDSDNFNLEKQHSNPMSYLVNLLNLRSANDDCNITGAIDYIRDGLCPQKTHGCHTLPFIMFYYAMLRSGISVTELNVADLSSIRNLA